MKKNIIAVAIAAAVALGATGCRRPEEAPKQYEGRVKYAGGNVYIDTETGVCYLEELGGICVMVDQDGSPYIANGWRDSGE